MIDTKPNLSDNKFEQCTGDILHLSGCTHVFGQFQIQSGATISILPNRGVGKILTSNSGGTATWQIPSITGADNGLSKCGYNVVLGGTLTGNTTIGASTRNLTLSSSVNSNRAICFNQSNDELKLSWGDVASACTGNVMVNADEVSLLSNYPGGGCSAGLSVVHADNRICFASTGATKTYHDNRGFHYVCDYSQGANSRWLPDKGYVDSLVSGGTGITGATNGLGIDGFNRVCLGGLINDGPTWVGNYSYGPMLGLIKDSGAATGAYLRYADTGNSTCACSYIRLGTFFDGGNIILDSRSGSTFKQVCLNYACALEYGDNYSLDYTNRSLVDKEYVDSLVSGGTSISSENITKKIYQASHGFALNDVLGWDATLTSYSKEIADGLYDGEIIGIVSKYIDVDNFDLTQAGYVTGLTAVFTPNDTYFLSDTTPGLLTNVEPTTNGYVVKAVLIADTTSSGWVLPYPGYLVTSGTTVGIVNACNGLSTDGVSVCLGGTLNSSTVICRNTFNLELGSSAGAETNITLTDNCISIQEINTTSEISMGTIGINITESNHGNYIDLISTGIDIYSDIAVHLGSASSPTTQTFICSTPNPGTCSDSVLVRDNGSGEIKVVPYLSGTTLSASNGLCVCGANVTLGGQLTGNTIIDVNGNSLEIGYPANNLCAIFKNNCIGLSGGSIFNIVGGVAPYICSYAAPGVSICLGTSGGGFNPSIELRTCAAGGDSLYLSGSGNTTFTAGLSTTGIVYASDYSGSFIDNSLVSKYYVDNLVTGNTTAITGGTNGLKIDGVNPRNLALGGCLYCPTTIDIKCNTFTICGAIGVCFIKIVEPDDSTSCLTLGSCTCTSLCSMGTGSTKIHSVKNFDLGFNGAGIITDSTAIPLGLQYASDTYRNNFTDCSLVDKKYVDEKVLTGATKFGWSNLAKGSTVAGCGTPASGNTLCNNTFYGVEAGKNTTSGQGNVAVGYRALYSNTGGSYNIAFGNQTLENNITGVSNFGAGNLALNQNTAGVNNIAIGQYSLSFNTTGNRNIALGSQSLYVNSVGDTNIAIGNSTLSSNTSGSSNIAMGNGAMLSNKTGNLNIAMGDNALYSNTIGVRNMAFGLQSMYNNTGGTDNIAMGVSTLLNNTSGGNNIALGYQAMLSNTIGVRNIAIGPSSLTVNTSGNDNIALGYVALGANTTGVNNIGLGISSLTNNTIGNYNIALGKNALNRNVCGCHNIALGEDTLYYNTGGTQNVAQGNGALYCHISGNYNAAYGSAALFYNKYGSDNVAIGPAAGYNATGSSNVFLGNYAGFNEIGSNKLYVDNSNTATPLIYGEFDNDKVKLNACLYVRDVANGNSSDCALTWDSVTCSVRKMPYSSGATNGATNGLSVTGTKIKLGGALTGNTALTGAYTLSVCDGAKLNTTCGYQISGVTVFRTSTYGGNAGTGLTSIFIGKCAGSAVADATGCNLFGVGYRALGIGGGGGSAGSNQVAIGYQALYNSYGQNNLAIGYKAAYTQSNSGNIIAIGNCALYANNGGCNVALGNCALATNTSGTANFAVGECALLTNSLGNNNIGFGTWALRLNTGSANIAMGYRAGDGITSGACNIGIGYQALFGSSMIGCDNVALGQNAMISSVAAYCNFAVGKEAMYLGTCPCNSIAIGYQALYANLTGYGNVALGYQALKCNGTSRSNNIAIGYQALCCGTSGYNNIALGIGSMARGGGGNDNVAMGCQGLMFNTGGTDNFAVGYNTLVANCNGSNNIGIGRSSLVNNTIGTDNTAFGVLSLGQNICGTNNFANGSYALYSNTCGCHNIGFGNQAAQNNTKGCNNVSIGWRAQLCNTKGCDSIAIGHDALFTNVSGSSNIAIGACALCLNVSGNRNIAIGCCAGFSETGSDKLYIANSGTIYPLICGDFAARSLCFNGSLSVSGNTCAPKFIENGTCLASTYLPFTMATDWQDPTGFVGGSNINVSYNYAQRKITLTGNLDYYWNGVKKTLTSPWTSSAHTTTVGTWYLYSTDGTNITWSQSVWSFSNLMVALVNYKSTSGTTFALRETHGMMPWSTHQDFHKNIGTYLYSGGVATSWTANTATDNANSPNFNSAVVADEDNQTTVSGITKGAYTLMRVSGATSIYTVGHTQPFSGVTNGFIDVNDPITGAWAPGINARYYNVYQILIPTTSDVTSQKFRTIFLQPQATYTTLATAQAEDSRGLYLGSLASESAEFIPYGRITYLTANANNNYGKVTIPTNGITYIIGNRMGSTSMSGVVSPTNHANLTNLTWTNSGHVGTNDTFAAFDATGTACNTLASTIAKYCTMIISGNSSATGFTVNHALGRQFVSVQVAQAASPYATIYTTVQRPNTNCVCVTFDTAPTSGTNYCIMITG